MAAQMEFPVIRHFDVPAGLGFLALVRYGRDGRLLFVVDDQNLVKIDCTGEVLAVNLVSVVVHEHETVSTVSPECMGIEEGVSDRLGSCLADFLESRTKLDQLVQVFRELECVGI